MSETFRSDDNEHIIRREDDGREEFFTEKEYESTEYQDVPEVERPSEVDNTLETENTPEAHNQKEMKEIGSKVNNIVQNDKDDKDDKPWYQNGQYE